MSYKEWSDRQRARQSAVVYYRELGWTYRAIGVKFGVSSGRVPQIIRNEQRWIERESIRLVPIKDFLAALTKE